MTERTEALLKSVEDKSSADLKRIKELRQQYNLRPAALMRMTFTRWLREVQK